MCYLYAYTSGILTEWPNWVAPIADRSVFYHKQAHGIVYPPPPPSGQRVLTAWHKQYDLACPALPFDLHISSRRGGLHDTIS